MRNLKKKKQANALHRKLTIRPRQVLQVFHNMIYAWACNKKKKNQKNRREFAEI